MGFGANISSELHRNGLWVVNTACAMQHHTSLHVNWTLRDFDQTFGFLLKRHGLFWIASHLCKKLPCCSENNETLALKETLVSLLTTWVLSLMRWAEAGKGAKPLRTIRLIIQVVNKKPLTLSCPVRHSPTPPHHNLKTSAMNHGQLM